jgi:hypothetical protein
MGRDVYQALPIRPSSLILRSRHFLRRHSGKVFDVFHSSASVDALGRIVMGNHRRCTIGSGLHRLGRDLADGKSLGRFYGSLAFGMNEVVPDESAGGAPKKSHLAFGRPEAKDSIQE